jgi:amino acid transporter
MRFDTLQVKNPSVDLPIGIVGSLVVCAFLYALMCVVICLMVPYDQVRPPTAAVARHLSECHTVLVVTMLTRHDTRCCWCIVLGNAAVIR